MENPAPVLTIVPVPLTPAAFAPFGEIIAIPPAPATDQGPGWAAWSGFPPLICPHPLAFGLVATRAREIVLEAMERHVETFEYLAPHGDALIQPVAPASALADPTAQPDPATVVAFVLPVGSAVVLAPGVWHSAAFPAGAVDTTYTYACLAPPIDPPAVWVPFAGEGRVRVQTANAIRGTEMRR